MDARVPVDERPSIPVLATERDVIWIPGICRSKVSVPKLGERGVRLEARRD